MFEAIILGIVEGLTEYLPVSSTGHLLVVSDLLGVADGDARLAADTFAVAVQLGAIVAVVVLYRQRLWSMWRGLWGRDVVGRQMLARLVVAFLPAAIVGVAAGDTLKENLFGPVPITIAWLVGAVVLLAWPRMTSRHPLRRDVVEMSLGSTALIGAAQVLAMWPGVSRSLVTLLAALALGATMATAVEFSFLLGLITLSAASVLDLVRNGDVIRAEFGVATPAVAAICAFVAAIVSVRWMVAWLQTRSLAIFGWYRLAIGATCVVLLATGVL